MADWRTMVDSLQSPMRRLQGEQRSPRTCPVVWLWSMCQFSSFKFGFRQIAQRLPCETAILCSSSSVIPYRVFRSYERLFFRASSLLLSLLIFLVTFMWSLFFFVVLLHIRSVFLRITRPPEPHIFGVFLSVFRAVPALVFLVVFVIHILIIPRYVRLEAE